MSAVARIVDAALAWAHALEQEYGTRFQLERVPMATLDENIAAAAAHKQALAAAFTAEVELLAAVRALQKEHP